MLVGPERSRLYASSIGSTPLVGNSVRVISPLEKIAAWRVIGTPEGETANGRIKAADLNAACRDSKAATRVVKNNRFRRQRQLS